MTINFWREKSLILWSSSVRAMAKTSLLSSSSTRFSIRFVTQFSSRGAMHCCHHSLSVSFQGQGLKALTKGRNGCCCCVVYFAVWGQIDESPVPPCLDFTVPNNEGEILCSITLSTLLHLCHGWCHETFIIYRRPCLPNGIFD